MRARQTHAPARGALIIGGDYRGLGLVRGLGRRGIPVWVLADDHRVAAVSRYARRVLTWPAGAESDQVAFLRRLATEHGLEGWTVFPTGDETAALLSRNLAALSEHYRLSVSPWEAMRWAYDKRLTHQLAAEVGVDVPRTYYPTRREQVAFVDYRFPVILKPAVKRQSNEFTRSKAWRVDGPVQLLERYDAACGLIDPELVMVQELIPGDGDTQFSYGALCDEGRPLAWLTARRIRQYPMDFGRFSTFVETVEAPQVESLARRLLAARPFSGLVEVEFKFDRRDNRYKLLDLNPRVWGWHTLARRAGIDFPYLAWRLANGEPIPDLLARPGARWVRFLPDLLVAVREIVAGRERFDSYLSAFRGPLEFAIFAADDPLPALCEIPLQMGRLGKRSASSLNLPAAESLTAQQPNRGVRDA
ncbi:MAG TPA: ATP-grasp domain-containing protein [Chloroflexota bacterium]|nr:ATP-grasp domain-containing protein [Chloroflexota bacterium]